jgi:nucleotide-binding universal stress UspA family protein
MTESTHLPGLLPAAPARAAPFPRVLLGIDFGPASLGAARWAAANVALRAEAILAHVMPAPEPDAFDGDEIERLEALREMRLGIAGGLGGFAATLEAASTRNLVRLGSPSRWLSAIANDTESALVVLGRRADANRTRVGEANVIERVARRTSASVLVVPERTATRVERIVAAVDQSAFAAKVLAVAKRLARLHEIPLVIVHVLSPTFGSYGRILRSARKVTAGGAGQGLGTTPSAPLRLPVRLGRWLVELGRSHNVLGRDSTEVTVGDPAREIASATSPSDRTLVVVGMRGADGAPPGSVGSVARELLTRGRMPVLAVNAI